ncbi:hypothetical protein BC939DRAFT_445776 [Gamsiella multidivaricata]|uniref:uncharacterized protein n=1 Tax=Gamsiella multidivaricata TaxID=101098 RepID=UPI00221E3B50|nr:uncharacterized protein BC939DRAFT_445776 [Gamsiella multidivaricata]KAG0356122.1 hypothetical protein BGZ54_000839 [Gamsiella multidivaricata]KAI7827099.1 hypothetical protein BC939DRAFT_445776 [Gamsiella multidivaricata]
MTQTSIHLQATPRDRTVDLGDGLIMRWSTKADSDNVAELMGEAFRWLSFLDPIPEGVIPGPSATFSSASRRLLSGKNGTMTDRDYALVEDTTRPRDNKNPIVACVAMQRHRAYYGCVDDIFFGKPELIATRPEYRNRGLVRKLLYEMIHPESEARGDALQFIAGIPHFYRQFGYTYAMANYLSGKIADLSSIPALPPGKTEPFILRKATAADIPYLVRHSTNDVSPYTSVGLKYGPEYYQYTVADILELEQPGHNSIRDTLIVVNAATGKDVGFSIVSHMVGLKVEALVLDDSVVLKDALYPILRQFISNEKHRLEAKKATLSVEEAEKFSTAPPYMLLQVHPKHPITMLLGSKIAPSITGPGYRVMTRIYDYPRFIRIITPELERRLSKSPMAGLTGRLRLDFYRKVEGNNAKGLEILFEDGKIVEAREWANPGPEKTVEEYLAWKAEDKVPVIYAAAFAPLTFHSLLTGDRSLEELAWSFGENRVKDEASTLLLNSLFPKVSHQIDGFFW